MMMTHIIPSIEAKLGRGTRGMCGFAEMGFLLGGFYAYSAGGIMLSNALMLGNMISGGMKRRSLGNYGEGTHDLMEHRVYFLNQGGNEISRACHGVVEGFGYGSCKSMVYAPFWPGVLCYTIWNQLKGNRMRVPGGWIRYSTWAHFIPGVCADIEKMMKVPEEYVLIDGKYCDRNGGVVALEDMKVNRDDKLRLFYARWGIYVPKTW